MRTIALFCLGLILTGCATVADIRAKEPYQTIESEKSPKEIANCVLHRAPLEVGTYIYTLSENPPGTFNIFIASPAPVGDAIFKPKNNGGSFIELRTQWNFWGQNDFWNCIQHCAVINQ